MTTKLGQFDKKTGNGNGIVMPIRSCKLYTGELAMATFVLSAALYGVFTWSRWSLCLYLTLQGVFAVSLFHVMRNHCVCPTIC